MPRLNHRVTGLLSILMAAGFLVVGWWPFSFRPINRVGWLKDRAGLSFEPDGIAYEAEPANWSAPKTPDQPATFTVELWLEPGANSKPEVFHILSIDDGKASSGTVFLQWQSALMLCVRDPTNKYGFRGVRADNVLREHTPRLLTVCADSSGITFYQDGVLLNRSPGFVVPAVHMNGRLILGDAATGKHAWTGSVFGLAAFNRALDASEVARDHAWWTNHEANALASEPALAALYVFDEGAGPEARDRSTNHHRLFIPEHYHVLQKRVLELPSFPEGIGRSELQDIVINLLGFVPFGFVLFWHRRLAGAAVGWRTVLGVVAVGATISLIIELTQVWLPNRCSSTADLFCNTLGTLIGALLAVRYSPGVNRLKDNCSARNGNTLK